MGFVVRLWLATGAAAAVAWAAKLAVGPRHPVLAAALILGPYVAVYFGAAALLKIEEVRQALARRNGWWAGSR